MRANLTSVSMLCVKSEFPSIFGSAVGSIPASAFPFPNTVACSITAPLDNASSIPPCPNKIGYFSTEMKVIDGSACIRIESPHSSMSEYFCSQIDTNLKVPLDSIDCASDVDRATPAYVIVLFEVSNYEKQNYFQYNFVELQSILLCSEMKYFDGIFTNFVNYSFLCESVVYPSALAAVSNAISITSVVFSTLLVLMKYLSQRLAPGVHGNSLSPVDKSSDMA
jgi:hypothetical protein